MGKNTPLQCVNFNTKIGNCSINTGRIRTDKMKWCWKTSLCKSQFRGEEIYENPNVTQSNGRMDSSRRYKSWIFSGRLNRRILCLYDRLYGQLLSKSMYRNLTVIPNQWTKLRDLRKGVSSHLWVFTFTQSTATSYKKKTRN